MTRISHWVLVLGTLLILIGAGASLRERIKVEESNKSTGLVVEWSLVAELAAAQGITNASALKSLKAQGLTHIAINEDTGGEMFSRGVLRFDPETQQYMADWRVLSRLSAGLKVKLGVSPAVKKFFDRDSVMDGRRVTVESIQTLPLGLDPMVTQAVREAGLGIVARLINAPGMTPKRIGRTFAAAHLQGASAYLPLGEQVIGFRDAIDRTAEALEETGMLYATPEFSKIAGDAKLAEAAKTSLVRLHPIQAAEADKLSPAEFNERFVKASRERGMRLLLIRPVNTSAEKPLFAFGESLKSLTRDLIREGAVVGNPRPFSAPEVPGWTNLLLRIGIALCAVWLVSALVASVPLAITLSVVLGLASMLNSSYAALVGALVFPVIGYVLWTQGCRWPAVLRFLLISFTSLIGGLCVSGLLNSLDTLVRLDTFSGVKLAHFAPIFVIFAWLLSQRVSFRELAQHPLRVGQLVLGFVGVAALAFMAMRSGNDAPGGVSGLELKLRSLLERFLIVRPRSKEFLLGHPALMLGLLMENDENSRTGTVAAVLLGIGAIGQTSIVNTLCHLHTPLQIGLLRIAVGLVLGAMIGLGIYAVIWAVRRTKRELAWRSES